MERELLLLGLLRSEAMHGYQLNEFIDSHLGATVHLTKPTAYRLLNRMVDEGWITYTEEREGNRPPRRVFAMAAEGEAAFQRMLRECLALYEPAVHAENVGLLFLDALPPEEAAELLRERRARVEESLEMAGAHDVHGGGGAALLLQHQVRHLATELEWLDEVIGHLELGGEDPGHGLGRGVMAHAAGDGEETGGGVGGEHEND